MTLPFHVKADVVCNQFEIKHQISDDVLSFSLLTDLPDDTTVMVSVNRIYQDKAEPGVDYSISYFGSKSTVRELKTTQKVLISNEQFNNLLDKERRRLSRFGLFGGVASIDNDIALGMTVPFGQFGKGNSRLTGREVTVEEDGWRLVRKELKIPYPLNAADIKSLPSLDPRNLDIGAIYIVSSETPLMPASKPTDSFEDTMHLLSKMKYIQKGTTIKILEKQSIRQTPWYKVQVLGTEGVALAWGWVNSTALIKQDLKAK